MLIALSLGHMVALDPQQTMCGRTLTSYEVVEFKMALVQLLAPYGVVSGDVQIGAPEAATRMQSTHTGRRLLQASEDH